MVGWKVHVHYALQICLCMRAREMGRDSHTHQSRRKPRPFCTSSKSPGTSPGTYRSGRLTLQEVAPPASFDRRWLSQPLARRRRRSEEEQWSSSFQCSEDRLQLRTPFLSHAHLLTRAPRVQSKQYIYTHDTNQHCKSVNSTYRRANTAFFSHHANDVTSFPPKISLLPSSSLLPPRPLQQLLLSPSHPLSHTHKSSHTYTPFLSLSLSLPLSLFLTHTQNVPLSLSLPLPLCVCHTSRVVFGPFLSFSLASSSRSSSLFDCAPRWFEMS